MRDEARHRLGESMELMADPGIHSERLTGATWVRIAP